MSRKQKSRLEPQSESEESNDESVSLEDEPLAGVDPYSTLELEKSATAEQVRSAYKKLALRNHPDKVAEADKETAHKKFQEIAFAYAILSDTARRSRYDTTGRTNESLDDDDDFNWADFFRSQFEDVISATNIAKFKEQYQNSDEERTDVITAFVNAEGDMNALFETVMLSNPLDDEARYRKWIDEDIAAGKVEAFGAYTKESKKSRKARSDAAKQESKEAEEYAKELGIHDKLFGGNKKGKKKSEDDRSGLAALIQQRQKARAGNFLTGLEEKLIREQNGRAGSKRKRGAEPTDEPSEEAFARNRAKTGRSKR